MEEKSLTDLFSQFFPSDSGDKSDKPGEQNPLLAESLKALAGQTNEPLRLEVANFLNGEGELHAATRAATSGGGGLDDIITMIAGKFKISPAIAQVIAQLLVKLLPGGGGGTSEKKKPRRKTSSSAKSEASTTKKKPKKESAAKKPASKPKPKTTKRSVDVEGL